MAVGRIERRDVVVQFIYRYIYYICGFIIFLIAFEFESQAYQSFYASAGVNVDYFKKASSRLNQKSEQLFINIIDT